MTDGEAGRYWEQTAEAWTRLARQGYDVYRDLFNTPAFLDLLPDVAGHVGLDLGCGEGHNTRLLASRGARMCAVDISPTFIRYARETEIEAPVGIRYAVASGQRLPFHHATFDFVTAFMSLMDMPQPDRALKEAFRVVKPGGFLQFSITHPCFDPPHRRLVRDSEGRTCALEVGRYFESTDGRIDRWLFSAAPLSAKAGLPLFQVPRFHQPLSVWFNAVLDAGFQIERVAEPFADSETAARFPEVADTCVAAYFLTCVAASPYRRFATRVLSVIQWARRRRTAMEQDRRTFLSAALAAPLFIPRRAWGANDRVAYGLIGAGGRGRYLNHNFQKLGAACVAVAEVYEPYMQHALQDSPDAKSYLDYHDLLAQSGIDAVVVATPDHQHCPCLLAAIAAGKDVYLEKPMSHSLEQSRQMVQAVRKTKQIVQVGMQRRSAESIIKAKQLLDSGVLGKITLVKPMWNWNVAHELDNTPLPGKLDWTRFLGPARERELQPMRFRSWRYFWDYSGGNMTDQGTHLMDVVQWFTNAGTAKSAICYGQTAKTIGSEVPDVFCAVFEYAGFMATWTLNYTNSYDNNWSIQFQGDQGTMIISDEGYKVWKEPWPKNRQPVQSFEAPVPIEPHIQNFLDCVKSRKEPNAPVEVGASAVSAPHLANVAFHNDRRMYLSADAGKATERPEG